MAEQKPKSLTLATTGTRRVVIGPGPKSKGGPRTLTILGAKADQGLDKAAPLSHTFEGGESERLRKSKVLDAVKDRFGLQVA